MPCDGCGAKDFRMKFALLAVAMVCVGIVTSLAMGHEQQDPSLGAARGCGDAVDSEIFVILDAVKVARIVASQLADF
eukprot:4200791-Amphidinium_carterae.1